MLTIYHLASSRSDRIIWLAEELGIVYAVERFDRDHAGSAPAAYKALHPLGRSPIIRDKNQLVVESAAIFEYLLGEYDRGQLVPKTASPQYTEYLQWLHFAEGSLSPRHLALRLLDFAGVRGGNIWDRTMDQLVQDVVYVDATLANRPFLAGKDFTASDIMMCMALKAAKQFAESLPAHPNIDKYLARLVERPAYQVAGSFG